MKKSKFTETQIVAILKQADAGVPIKDIRRQAAIRMLSGAQVIRSESLMKTRFHG
jgi:hypothetical protein